MSPEQGLRQCACVKARASERAGRMASGPPPAGPGAQAPGGGAPGIPPAPTAAAPQPDLLTNSTPTQGAVSQSSSGEGGSQAQGPGQAGGAPRAPSPDNRPKVMQRVGSGIRQTLRGKKIPAPALGTSEKNLPSTNPSVVNEVARKYVRRHPSPLLCSSSCVSLTTGLGIASSLSHHPPCSLLLLDPVPPPALTQLSWMAYPRSAHLRG